jgi:hypothetical protein
VYKAVVTLSAKTGYTFTGVAADSFSHSGATSVTNNANSGVVTITFQPTAAVVDQFGISDLITAPAAGLALDSSTNTLGFSPQYTGTIQWKTGGVNFNGPVFAAGTVYQAELSLTAASGRTFTGVEANSFICTKATSISHAAGSGTTLTVTMTFPATAATVNALTLSSLVTAPVAGYIPDTTGINETQYTGNIAWYNQFDATIGTPFAVATVYKAVVSLSAKPGYTFTGVAADSFSYTGALSVSNAANSGVVTITFPSAPAVIAQSELDNTLTLTGVVSVPQTDWTPNTPPQAPPSTQYNRNVVYRTLDDQPVPVCAANTVYKALVTLSANSGYSFYGLPVNNFIHTGATSVSAVNNGATIVVTIVFPATGP